MLALVGFRSDGEILRFSLHLNEADLRAYVQEQLPVLGFLECDRVVVYNGGGSWRVGRDPEDDGERRSPLLASFGTSEAGTPLNTWLSWWCIDCGERIKPFTVVRGVNPVRCLACRITARAADQDLINSTFIKPHIRR